jgi:putative aldouronate transport system substrate-binding protein
MKKSRFVLTMVVCMFLFAQVTLFAGGNKESAAAGDSGPVELTLLTREFPDFPMKQDTPVIQEIERVLGIKLILETVPNQDYLDTKLPALMAVNEIPDIVYIDSRIANKYGPMGMLVPISDYSSQTPNFNKIVNSRSEIKKVYTEGTLYYFPQTEYFRIGLASMPIIRTDLLDKYGLEVPGTFDELFDALMVMKKNDPSIVGVTGRIGIEYVLGQWSFAMGSGGFPAFTFQGMYWEPRENRWLYGPAQKNFKDLVAYFNKLYENGLLDPDIPTGDTQLFRQKMTTGKAVFTWDNSTKPEREYNPGLAKTDPNAKFEVIPPLQNNDGNTRALGYFKDWLEAGYAISAKSPHVDAAIKLLDWMYSEEGTIATNWGIEGETYTMENGEPLLAPELLGKYKNEPNGYNTMMSEIGGGLLAFTPSVDERNLIPFQEELMSTANKINKWQSDGLIHSLQYNPPFTKKEADELSKLRQQVDQTLFPSEIWKFITGKRPISEYDAFAEELMKDGGKRMQEIFNEAQNRL